MSLLLVLAVTWSCAVLWFVYSMPTESVAPTVQTEALVVLTGGQGRVEHGIQMLAQGAAPVLLISGVGEHVTVSQMLAEHAPVAVRRAIAASGAEIVLDHVSRTTVSNAGQSTAFLRDRDIHTIRLVTANYHMKRALREFHDASPEIAIIPDPVFPDEFRRDGWWQHDNTRRLVFSEFYKYLAVLLRDALRPNSVANSAT